MKNGEYIQARVSINQARKEITNAQTEINEMAKNTNLPDHIFGMLYGLLLSFTKALIFSIPTFGASFAIAGVKNLYTSCNSYYEKIKNKDKLDASSENTYLNHVKHVLNEVIRTLNKIEAEIHKKENDTSSDVKNKKKAFKKKNKNITESVDTKVLLASDLLNGMDDLF